MPDVEGETMITGCDDEWIRDYAATFESQKARVEQLMSQLATNIMAFDAQHQPVAHRQVTVAAIQPAPVPEAPKAPAVPDADQQFLIHQRAVEAFQRRVLCSPTSAERAVDNVASQRPPSQPGSPSSVVAERQPSASSLSPTQPIRPNLVPVPMYWLHTSRATPSSPRARATNGVHRRSKSPSNTHTFVTEERHRYKKQDDAASTVSM